MTSCGCTSYPSRRAAPGALHACAPDLNPVESSWSLLKRSMANCAAAELDGLVRLVKRKLKKIQYRPHLIGACLTATGLKTEP